MKLSEFIVEHLVDKYGVKLVFTVTGGGAMYLNDAFGKSDKLKCIYMHHEQSASMACESYSKINGALAVCQITTGPGGTNTISGCAGAWIDSVPVLFISGQVESFSRMHGSIRQSGVQEINIVDLVKPITKIAIELKDPYLVKYELERIISIALEGRMGPVWLDIPLEIQNWEIGNPSSLIGYSKLPIDKRISEVRLRKLEKLEKLIHESRRPVFCIGSGCKDKEELRIFLDAFQVPVIVGWNAKDMVSSSYGYLMGSAGLFGNRVANILISQADLIVGIGYRFSVPQVGYNPAEYIRDKTVISVDIDPNEVSKCSSFIDYFIHSNADVVISHLNAGRKIPEISGWRSWATYLLSYGFDKGRRDKKGVDSFDFTTEFEKFLCPGDIVVTDMGNSFTCTHQAINLPIGVRLVTSSGLAAMGFGLPGAIGADFAKNDGTTYLISGDGGLMFNLQELQTAKTYNLNLKIIIYENNGYLTMKHMQKNRFGRIVGADNKSNLECPDFIKVASAFEIESREISSSEDIKDAISWLRSSNHGPSILVVHLDPWQDLTPRVQTESDKNGKLYPATLNAMYPFISEETKNKLSDKYFEFMG